MGDRIKEFEDLYENIKKKEEELKELTIKMNFVDDNVKKEVSKRFIGKYYKKYDIFTKKHNDYFYVEKVELEKDFKVSLYLSCSKIETWNGKIVRFVTNCHYHIDNILECIEIKKEEFDKMVEEFMLENNYKK